METVQNFYTSLIVGGTLTMVAPHFQATINDKQMSLEQFLEEHNFRESAISVTDINNNGDSLVSVSGVMTTAHQQKYQLFDTMFIVNDLIQAYISFTKPIKEIKINDYSSTKSPRTVEQSPSQSYRK